MMKRMIFGCCALLLCSAVFAKEKIVSSYQANHDFAFGTHFWGLYRVTHPNPLNWKAPSVKNGIMTIDRNTSLWSRPFDIEVGQTYTVSARVRCAVGGKRADAAILMVDGAWFCKTCKKSVGSEWTTLSFPITFPYSRQARAYFRLDTGNEPIELDYVAVEKSNKEQAVPAKLPVRLGFVGQRILSTENSNGKITLKAIVAPNAKLPVQIQVVTKDLWGKEILNQSFTVRKVGTVFFDMPISNKIKGVFTCEATSGSAYGVARYAMVTPTDKMALPFHITCGHFDLFAQPNREVFDRYTTMKTNRYFDDCETTPPRPAKRLHQVWKASGYQNIICLSPDNEKQNPVLRKCLWEETGISEECRKAFVEYLNRIIPNVAGEGVYAVELFNEPNLWSIQQGAQAGTKTMEPEKVVELLKIARPIVRKLAPNLGLAGPTLCGLDLKYMQHFIDAGGLNYVDVVSVHPYCDNAELNETFQKFEKIREMIRKNLGHDMPLINTEQYLGVRGTPTNNQDSEYFRNYIKDDEWSYTKDFAENLAHHAAAETEAVIFIPAYIVDGFREECWVYHAFGVLNAATIAYAKAGSGTILDTGNDAVRCFYFAKAQPCPMAVLYTPGNEAKGKVVFHDPVKVLDVMGNELKSDPDGVDLRLPVYVYFPNGNAEKILERADWLNLGKPFRCTVSVPDEKTIAVKLVNRQVKVQKVNLTLRKLPSAWSVAKPTVPVNLAPREEKTVSFQLSRGTVQSMKNYKFDLRLLVGNAFTTEHVKLTAVFLPYSEDLSLDKTVWNDIRNRTENFGDEPKFACKGQEDLSAKFAAVWNETGLKLIVRVKDDKFCFNNLGEKSYNSDSLQIYFDMLRDTNPEADTKQKNMKDDLYYLIFNDGKKDMVYLTRNETNRYLGAANQPTGVDSEVKTKTRMLSKNEMEYQIFFPAHVLSMVKFAQGSRFGFSILVNDNDGVKRKQRLSLAPEGKSPYMNPAQFLDMILTK